MPYRVLMELVARPDNIPEWLWNEPASNMSYSTGGKAWTAKLNTNDTVWEYDSESDANTKMAALDTADSTNRRYKVMEV